MSNQFAEKCFTPTQTLPKLLCFFLRMSFSGDLLVKWGCKNRHYHSIIRMDNLTIEFNLYGRKDDSNTVNGSINGHKKKHHPVHLDSPKNLYSDIWYGRCDFKVLMISWIIY